MNCVWHQQHLSSTVVLQCYTSQAIPMEQCKMLYSLDWSPNLVWLPLTMCQFSFNVVELRIQHKEVKYNFAVTFLPWIFQALMYCDNLRMNLDQQGLKTRDLSQWRALVCLIEVRHRLGVKPPKAPQERAANRIFQPNWKIT